MNTQEDWTGQTVLFWKPVNDQESTPRVGGVQETAFDRSAKWWLGRGLKARLIETYKKIEALCMWTAINGVSKTVGRTR